MQSKKVTIIDYGCGNILNLIRAIKFIGYEVEVTHEKNKIIPHQIGFYSNPKRDEYNFDSKDNPSLHKQVMSVAYAAILNKEVIPFSGSDAEEAKYFKVKEVLNGEIAHGRLAFDHNQILKDSLSYISEKMKFTPIALDFLKEEFTIGEIRSVYEAFWSITDNLDSIDLSNFHKKVLSQKSYSILFLLYLNLVQFHYKFLVRIYHL